MPELLHQTYQALKLLYEKKPKSKRAIEHAYGYAVFVDTSYTAGFIGGGHGRGRAVNNSNGTEVFMKMARENSGLGQVSAASTQSFCLLDTIDAFTSFITKGWTFGGQAAADATDDVHGDSLEGSFQVAPGMWMYHDTSRFVAELTGKTGTCVSLPTNDLETQIPASANKLWKTS